MTTKVSDLVVREVLVDAVKAAFKADAGKNALFGTRAVITSPTMPHGKNKVGTKVVVPYFDSLGEWDVIADGQAFTPSKLTQTAEESIVRKVGKAFSYTDWAEMAAAGDPYVEASRQARAGFDAMCDLMLLEELLLPIPAMTSDVYSATIPRWLDGDILTDARISCWGDEGDHAADLFVHSQTDANLRKIKDSKGIPLFTDPVDGAMPRVWGLDVAVSDRLTPSSDTPPKYTSIVTAPGCLALWYNGEPLVETARDILSGADIVVISNYVVVHRYSRMPLRTKPGVVLVQHN